MLGLLERIANTRKQTDLSDAHLFMVCFLVLLNSNFFFIGLLNRFCHFGGRRVKIEGLRPSGICKNPALVSYKTLVLHA